MFTIDFLELVLDVSVFGKENAFAEGFSINSKQVKKGDCFVGLLGISRDGGASWREALDNGASGLLLNQSFYNDYMMSKNDYPDSWAFFVDDTKKALIQIAKRWRCLFNIPIIAVTGSVGKTTTKEMLRSIFKEAGWAVCATENSQNGSIGLPLSILSLRKDHQIAIFEVGVQKPGEMDTLIEILQSVMYSVVTTILESHIEYFHDINNIIKEKMKLQYITSDTCFIDYNFKKYAQHKNIISIGTHDNADFCYQSLSTQVIIDIVAKNKQFAINAGYHEGLRHCSVIAFAVAFAYMIRPKKIIYALENFERVPGRFSIHHLKSGSIIINDCYNSAHPTVMLTSINAFEVFPVFKKKILILGDMLEQGENKYRNHEIIIERVNAIPESVIETVYYVGEAFNYNSSKNKRNNVFFVSSFVEISDQVSELLNKKYCVFFKSSRAMLFFNYVSDYLQKINKE